MKEIAFMKSYFSKFRSEESGGKKVAESLLGEEEEKVMFLVKEGYVSIAPVRIRLLRPHKLSIILYSTPVPSARSRISSTR